MISIEVPRELLFKRLGGPANLQRRAARSITSISSRAAQEGVCDFDGQPLFTRSDDNEESIAQRLALYDEKTRPLLDHYEKSGRLKKVDGSGTPEDVFERMVKAVARLRMQATRVDFNTRELS